MVMIIGRLPLEAYTWDVIKSRTGYCVGAHMVGKYRTFRLEHRDGKWHSYIGGLGPCRLNTHAEQMLDSYLANERAIEEVLGSLAIEHDKGRVRIKELYVGPLERDDLHIPENEAHGTVYVKNNGDSEKVAYRMKKEENKWRIDSTEVMGTC